MPESYIVPKSEPFLIPGGKLGCLLLHGFTSMPEEMRPLGEYLGHLGYTVLCPRLAGHATHPMDLARTHWKDWLVTVEDSLALLSGMCTQVVVIGQSMGGMIALLATARHPFAGTVVVSTPFDQAHDWRNRSVRFWSTFIPLIFKGLTPILNLKTARRERDYPAYPYFPTRIFGEVEDLKTAMRAEMGKIESPVLVIQSRKDPDVPPENAEHLFSAIRSPRKELFWLEDAGHSVVQDPLRQAAFEKILDFVREIETAK